MSVSAGALESRHWRGARSSLSHTFKFSGHMLACLPLCPKRRNLSNWEAASHSQMASFSYIGEPQHARLLNRHDWASRTQVLAGKRQTSLHWDPRAAVSVSKIISFEPLARPTCWLGATTTFTTICICMLAASDLCHPRHASWGQSWLFGGWLWMWLHFGTRSDPFSHLDFLSFQSKFPYPRLIVSHVVFLLCSWRFS